MCGIVGLISAFSNGFAMDEAAAFRDMLLIDTLRGFDSTGVFGVDNYSNVEILKEASNGASFIKTKDYNAFDTWILQRGVFAVGHNRAATRGSITDKNAHPFHVEDNIILVQNGTYKGDHSHHKDTEVDTEAIAHVIHETPNIEEALQKINAAYALVWYNVKERTLNIIRNDERPLYIAYTKMDSIIFASEMETILAACSRNKITLREKPYLLCQDTLNTWTLDEKGGWTFSDKKIDNKFRGEVAPSWHETAYGTMWNVQPRLAAPRVATPAPSFSEISTTMFEYIHKGEFTDFLMTYRDSEEYCTKLQQAKSINVELYDYKPCNELANCNTWYALFKAVEPNDTVSAVIYAIIKGKREEEIIAMSEDTPFYNVEITALPVKHNIRGPNLEQGHVVSLFVHNLQPIVFQ